MLFDLTCCPCTVVSEYNIKFRCVKNAEKKVTSFSDAVPQQRQSI